MGGVPLSRKRRRATAHDAAAQQPRRAACPKPLASCFQSPAHSSPSLLLQFTERSSSINTGRSTLHTTVSRFFRASRTTTSQKSSDAIAHSAHSAPRRSARPGPDTRPQSLISGRGEGRSRGRYPSFRARKEVRGSKTTENFCARQHFSLSVAEEGQRDPSDLVLGPPLLLALPTRRPPGVGRTAPRRRRRRRRAARVIGVADRSFPRRNDQRTSK